MRVSCSTECNAPPNGGQNTRPFFTACIAFHDSTRRGAYHLACELFVGLLTPGLSPITASTR
jgi:hypothetical protein